MLYAGLSLLYSLFSNVSSFSGRNISGSPPSPTMQMPMLIDQDPLERAVLREWSTGLFDCCDDPSNCIITCCIPCITIGQNAEIIDKGATSCLMGGLTYYVFAYVGVPCLYTCSYRKKMRHLYSLQEDPCADCLVHWCCSACALCQEHRELKNRGLHPSIGWAANAKRMNQDAATVVPTMQGMDR